MGKLFSKLWQKLFIKGEFKILMLGLDGAGKTTILYSLKLGNIVNTVPTLGFNVERLNYHNISFIVWDAGGQEKIRPLWRYYYQNTQGLIFVIDSSDIGRIEDASNEFQRLLDEDQLRDADILIFANKKDLSSHVNDIEIVEKFGLKKNLERNWFVQSTCATRGEGIYEGMDWLSRTIMERWR